jgi:hypothetical protein
LLGKYTAQASGMKVNEFKLPRVIEPIGSNRFWLTDSGPMAKPA